MDAGVCSPGGLNPSVVALRSTQRAPRSCTRCSRRKIRCDQRIPCSQCIKKGTPETCSRETVLVRGSVTTARVENHVPTYDELLADNERLKSVTTARCSRSLSPLTPRLKEDYDCDFLERYLFENVQQVLNPSNFDAQQIIFPSRDCSNKLINYDKTWNSWVHYAVQYPEFDQEHDLLWELSAIGIPPDQTEPGWLALYFAVLAVRTL
ncbi:hypothetical protein LTR10_014618 [Elasticomyces elasticus]|uniref:Zn(2)-C6 fungal-type domain-containing protein n=1 Tax=Exophiala sideris TaxID=1016849 RepID=A0ABR0JSK3_9EURO|nr:hypothetical protein LTR10_014618 [Elasticomyces elasticus]KAK5040595.1 hypothetical protein LTS07_001095 [Exophiala sideris]KAK5042980.1 hypothetical protein LTR13_000750 [Exophiala sideris]KAK5068973.1 hypothetical protein LTR69_001096 [Exophiala sideris]KAK5186570.1 hypothetical protein LTR44_001627 [Eurotiomycetes sp. CCFEE 6388]